MNLQQHFQPIQNLLLFLGITSTLKIIPYIDYKKIKLRNNINPSFLFFIIDLYCDNIRQNILPNVPNFSFDFNDDFLKCNSELLEIIATTLARHSPFFKAFLPIPTNQYEFDLFILCAQLVHLPTRSLKIINDAIKKFSSKTIFVDPVIIKSLPRSQFFDYFIYSLRSTFNLDPKTNYISIPNLISFFKPSSTSQKKYLLKKIKLASLNSKFFYKLHNNKLYFKSFSILLSNHDRIASTGDCYFAPTNLNHFKMICLQSLASNGFIYDKLVTDLKGRSIQTLALQSGYSKSTIIKMLKPQPRIYRFNTITSFHYYEDALDYTKSYNSQFPDSFMYIHKTFFKDRNKEVFINAYECRIKLSNFYVQNSIRRKVFIKDFHESFVLDPLTNKYVPISNQSKSKRLLSKFKLLNPNPIIKSKNLKPTVRSHFPYIPSDHPCHQSRHNPDKLIDYSSTPADISFFDKPRSIKRTSITKPRSKSKSTPASKGKHDDFFDLPCYHPYVITSRSSRSEFIKFNTDPEYKEYIINKYQRGSAKPKRKDVYTLKPRATSTPTH